MTQAPQSHNHHDTEQEINCSVLMQNMCQSIRDAIVVYDAGGQIKAVNRSAESITGYMDRELLGQNMSLILPYLDPTSKDSDYLTQMTSACGAKGNTFAVEVMLTEFRNENERYYLAIFRNLSENGSSADDLSPRQRQVLKLVVQGYTSQEIATQLTISIKTVETHRANIMTKLGVRNVSSLVRYAVENNII